jgi:hypothetical protein
LPLSSQRYAATMQHWHSPTRESTGMILTCGRNENPPVPI